MARTPEKMAFADRLKQALTRSPKRIQTPSELALQFNLVHSGGQITNQAAQKWLSGENRPSPDKIETLAKMLNVSCQWLRYGIPEQRTADKRSGEAAETEDAKNPTADELRLLGRYRRLSAHQRELVADLVEQLALTEEMWSVSS